MLLAWHGAAVACRVQQRAAVPLVHSGGRLLVPVVVNGQTGLFVLDTGAERSLVTPQAVQRFGLALDQWVGTTMRGVGGVVQHRNADPRSLSLGGVPLQRRTVTHDTSLTVGAMHLGAVAGQPVAGLLGRDFLSGFDLSIDLHAGTLTLYDVQDCHGRFLPWPQPYADIPAQQPTDTAMVLPVRLDGVALRALLDTGASASVLTARGMAMLHLTTEGLARGRQARATGLGPQQPAMQRHRFATLQIGGRTERDPLLWVSRIRVVPIVDMLLGVDWLRGHRVWVSFATAQVFVASGPGTAAASAEFSRPGQK